MAGDLKPDLTTLVDTGYGKFLLLALSVWIVIPVVNALVGTSIGMDVILTINGFDLTIHRGVVLMLGSIGVFSYVDLRFGPFF